MSTHSRHDTDQAIFEHAAFVQALARQLVAPEAAGDVEQETWLAALEGRTGSGRPSSRAWLGGIVKNLARHEYRSRRRRAERERRAARSEPSPSALDDAQRRESLRHLSRAVFELEEPLQAVVVYRYYDGLSRAAIAERLGIGVEGVKSRLQRALAELRTRLDREHDGNRSAWALAIAPALPAADATPVGMWILGTLVMSIKKSLLISATLLVAIAAMFFSWTRETPGDANRISRAKSPLASAAATDADNADDSPTDAATRQESTPLARDDTADAPRGATIIGQVVDERRRPVPDTTVELWMAHQETRSTRTDADGRFRIDNVGRPDEGSASAGVLAFDGQGMAAATACLVYALSMFDSDSARRAQMSADDPIDTGVIPLGRAQSLEILVRDGDETVSGVEVIVESGLERLPVRRLTTGADGKARLPWFPEGAVFASASIGDRVGYAQGAIDETSRSLPIELRPARSIEVIVRDAMSGLPLEGAEIVVTDVRSTRVPTLMGGFTSMRHAFDLDVEPTDASGRTLISTLPIGERLSVTASKTGFGFARRGQLWRDVQVQRVLDGVDTLEFELTRIEWRSVRVPLVDCEVPIPVEGTRIAIRERPGAAPLHPELRPTVSRIEQNSVRIDNVPPKALHALAETPEGALATIFVTHSTNEGRETCFVQPRSVTVDVRLDDGSPAHGVTVLVKTPGNNAMAAPARTDADGHVHIEGLHAERIEVFVEHPKDPLNQVLAGSADLRAGDAHFDVSMPIMAMLELQLVDRGAPRLPKTYRLHVQSGGSVVEERPEAGVLVVAVELRATIQEFTISLFAEDYVTEVHKVPRSAIEVAEPFRIELVRAGIVRTTLRRQPDTKIGLILEKWNEEAESWRLWEGSIQELERANDAYGRVCFEPLETGRYRVVDMKTGRRTDAVEISPNHRVADVFLDLTASRRIFGRVIAPADTDLSLTRIVALEMNGVPPETSGRWRDRIRGVPDGADVRADGTFHMFIPTDRTVILVARHPILRASSNGGFVETSSSSEEIELVLEPGPELRFAVPQGSSRSRYGGNGFHVVLYQGNVEGTPVMSAFAPVADGVARFGGFDPGVYTLWIGPSTGYAPVILRDFELRDGVQEIDVDFERGSAIRARILVPEGEVVPRMYISAISERDPEYLRQINSRGEAEVLLPGLGAGSFKLHYFVFGLSERHDEVITVDGVRDHEITIDLR